MAVGSLRSLCLLADLLSEAATATVSAARRKYEARRYSPRGATLHPGRQTPLWNELALAVRKSFRRRGDQSRLARYLGLSRQRLHVLLVARAACPDAERTLQLLVWLRARQRGDELDR